MNANTVEIMPHDANAEHYAIGYILNCKLMPHSDACASLLDAECFYENEARWAFETIAELINEGEVPDLIHVSAAQYARKVNERVETYTLAKWFDEAKTKDIRRLITTLRMLKAHRAAMVIANDLLKGAKDTTLPIAEQVNLALQRLEALDVVQQAPSKTLQEVVPELLKRIDDNRNPNARHHGPYIGLDEIDSTGGLPETGLVVLAGGTSSGKSSVAAGILMQSAKAGMKGFYISLEMPNRSLVSRMTAMQGHGLSGRDLLTRPLTNDAEYGEALGDIESLRQRYGEMIYFDDSRSSNLDDICAGIRQMTRNHGIKVVVVDFVQLLNFTMQNNKRQQMLQNVEQLMAMASRRLKNLADSLGVCVVMLSQLNRSMDRQRPTLSSVRDSGQIAEAADMVILTWRPEQYHGQYDQELAKYSAHETMAVLVAKNREGALMDIIARWDGQRTLMRQMTALERSLAMGGGREERLF